MFFYCIDSVDYVYTRREGEREIYMCVCVHTYMCIYTRGVSGTRLVREADVMSLEVADYRTVTLAILREHW